MMMSVLFVCLMGLFSYSEAATRFSVDDLSKDNQQSEVLAILGAAGLTASIEGAFHPMAEGIESLRIYRYTNGKSHEEILLRKNNDNKALILSQSLSVNTSTIKVTFNSSIKKTRAQPIVVQIFPISPLERLNKIKTPLLDNINNILSYGAAQVSKNIEKNVTLINELQQKQTQSQNSDVDLRAYRSQVAAVFHDLSVSYASAQDIKKQSQAGIDQAFKSIKGHANSTQKELNHVQQKINHSQNKITLLQQGDGDIDENKRQLTLTAEQRILSSLEIQQQAWQAFYQNQMAIYPLLQEHVKKTNLLLDILSIYANVYLEFSYAIQLGQDIDSALKILNNVVELDTAINNMMQNMKKIKVIQQKLDTLSLQ